MAAFEKKMPLFYDGVLIGNGTVKISEDGTVEFVGRLTENQEFVSRAMENREFVWPAVEEFRTMGFQSERKPA